MGFTEKHFASSFTLTPLSYASRINFRASLCSIVLTFFASVIPLFAQKLKYCAVLLKIAIGMRNEELGIGGGAEVCIKNVG